MWWKYLLDNFVLKKSISHFYFLLFRIKKPNFGSYKIMIGIEIKLIVLGLMLVQSGKGYLHHFNSQ